MSSVREPEKTRSMVRGFDVRCVAIRIGEHGDGFDPDPPQRAHDSHRDLAAIRDEHPVHGSHTTNRTGVGFQPLQGLLSCGQLEMTKSVSRSAWSST